MATIMEKDVLLELASIGHLIPNNNLEEYDNDLNLMADIWNRVLDAKPQDIDYFKTLKEIKSIRDKYDRK